jgi:hypothetical protein
MELASYVGAKIDTTIKNSAKTLDWLQRATQGIRWTQLASRDSENACTLFPNYDDEIVRDLGSIVEEGAVNVIVVPGCPRGEYAFVVPPAPVARNQGIRGASRRDTNPDDNAAVISRALASYGHNQAARSGDE